MVFNTRQLNIEQNKNSLSLKVSFLFLKYFIIQLLANKLGPSFKLFEGTSAKTWGKP
jgi:hypothetical protein